MKARCAVGIELRQNLGRSSLVSTGLVRAGEILDGEALRVLTSAATGGR
ncbi:hypothetical protein AB0H83_48690 [Dactylosporangium sp. NPDC050688]